MTRVDSTPVGIKIKLVDMPSITLGEWISPHAGYLSSSDLLVPGGVVAT
jgi:hypothetical protein